MISCCMPSSMLSNVMMDFRFSGAMPLSELSTLAIDKAVNPNGDCHCILPTLSSTRRITNSPTALTRFIHFSKTRPSLIGATNHITPATMDFASLMKKEMSKSKKPPASSTIDTKDTAAPKKYMKRSEIEAERQAAYLAEKKAIEDARAAKLTEKRKRDEEAAAEDAEREEKRRRLAEESRRVREEKEWEDEQARRRRLGLPERKRRDKDAEEENEQEAELGAGEEDIVEEELVAKLRDLGEPVVLFGEGHRGRLRRYRRLTTVVTKGPIPTTLQPVEEKHMKIDGKVPQDPESRRWLFRQLASYFIMVMTAYEQAMEAESRDTTASRNAYAAMVQTRENIKPVSPFLRLSVRAMVTNIISSYSANSRRVISRIPCWSQS